jgi:hypothetical protein
LRKSIFIDTFHFFSNRLHGETDAKIAPQIIHFLKIARSGYRQKADREREILKCIYCNECREAEGAVEEVTCIQWKKKNGSIVIPNP